MLNHNYYQQDLYKNIFIEIWDKLKEKKIVSKSLEEIENSELFKYSPFKSLNEDQYNSVMQIIETVNTNSNSKIFIKVKNNKLFILIIISLIIGVALGGVVHYQFPEAIDSFSKNNKQ